MLQAGGQPGRIVLYNRKMPAEEKPVPAPAFEAGLQELEAIVKQMESSDLPLERALELFEKGMKLSESCRKQLEEAETRIEILVRKGDRVQPEPFGPDKG
jgi:exodeoxyribonuclease VII small subunit